MAMPLTFSHNLKVMSTSTKLLIKSQRWLQFRTARKTDFGKANESSQTSSTVQSAANENI